MIAMMKKFMGFQWTSTLDYNTIAKQKKQKQSENLIFITDNCAKLNAQCTQIDYHLILAVWQFYTVGLVVTLEYNRHTDRKSTQIKVHGNRRLIATRWIYQW